jgi:hypothetical protein
MTGNGHHGDVPEDTNQSAWAGRTAGLAAPSPHGHCHHHELHPAHAGATGVSASQVSPAAPGTIGAFQAVPVVITGSLALPSDTIPDPADALTAGPLWMAFAPAGEVR